MKIKLPYRDCNCPLCVEARGRRAPASCELCGQGPRHVLWWPYCGPDCREMARELEATARKRVRAS